MSLQQVQARAAEIQQRLQALAAGGPGRGTLGVAGPAADVFAATLQTATLQTPSARTAGAATGAGAVQASGPVPLAPLTGRTALLAGSTGASTTGADVVTTAKQQLGRDYVWGGESVSEGGFDCSGLVQWTYKQHGIDLPRVSSDQARAGRPVPPEQAQPGDLVYFERQAPRPDHIGLYAGNGQWVVAPKTGDVVKLQAVDLSQATTIRRILPDHGVPASSLRTSAGWSAGLPAAGQRYAGLVEQAAQKAGVDPRLLAALAWSESGFDPTARSGAGAQGLVQLMPATARGLGVADPTDPAQSLAGGAAYLRTQLDAFGGDPTLALAAYNAGPTAVRRHGGVPPYAETRTYVTTVLDRFRALGGTP